MNILSILSNDNFITVNKTIAAEVGLEAAVILGELASEYVYWSRCNGLEDGYFYSTIENLEKKTFLSGHNQRIALSILQEKGWIEVSKKGLPAKRYIKIFDDKIMDFFNDKSSKILTTGDEKIEQQEIEIFNTNKNIEKKNIEKEYKDIYDVPQKKTRFVPPTLEEVQEYCWERQNNVDPQKFIDHYSSNGWKVGRNPMKDWKAAVRTWERSAYDKPKINAPFDNPFTEMLREEGYQ